MIKIYVTYNFFLAFLNLTFQHLITDFNQYWTQPSCVIFWKHLSDFLYPATRVGGLLANNRNAATWGSTADLEAGPAPSRRGSTNATLIRMGEATALPLVLCGLLQNEFGSPFSMPSRRSSHGPPTATSSLLLEQSMKASLPPEQAENGKRNHFSRNALLLIIRIYQSQFLIKFTWWQLWDPNFRKVVVARNVIRGTT